MTLHLCCAFPSPPSHL